MRRYYGKKTAQNNNNQFLNDENFEDYLTDNVDDNSGDDNVVNDMDLIPDPYTIDKQRTQIPQEAPEQIVPNPFVLVYEGIENKELISFDYTTRNGTYVGKRVVEPHYTFFAQSTGNEILVSFDRTVNDIRAFIIGNIHSNGVKYNQAVFMPRGSIISV